MEAVSRPPAIPPTFLQVPLPRFSRDQVKVTVQQKGLVMSTDSQGGAPVEVWVDHADATGWPNVYLAENQRIIIERLK